MAPKYPGIYSCEGQREGKEVEIETTSEENNIINT